MGRSSGRSQQYGCGTQCIRCFFIGCSAFFMVSVRLFCWPVCYPHVTSYTSGSYAKPMVMFQALGPGVNVLETSTGRLPVSAGVTRD